MAGWGHLRAVALGVILAAAQGLAARAAISIDAAEVVFSDGERQARIVVVNEGDRPTFVQIAAREILNPGEEPPSANTGPDPRQVGLLAAPSRLALAPGERRAVRLDALDTPRDRDRVWRVLIQEVAGPIISETSGVAVLVGYDVLVIQRPEAPEAVLDVVRDGGTLTVTNRGNSFAILIDGKQCAGADEACADVVGTRLYAGVPRTLTAPDPAAPITFTLRTPGKPERQVQY